MYIIIIIIFPSISYYIVSHQYALVFFRLHDQMSIDSLTDAIILKVFHYLDVKSLCRSSQV